MRTKVFEGKVMNDVIQAAQDYFQHKPDKFIINVLEEKKGIFGIGAHVSAEITLQLDPLEEGKKYLEQVLSDLNLTGTVEVETAGKNVTYRLMSDNNGFLIGKNGKALQSLQILVTQLVNQHTEDSLKVTVDVDNYRKKQRQRLEFLAKKVAKEVSRTKIDAKLDPMNAYERRLIHQTLSKWENIQTKSEGEDPHRYLIIKYKK